MGFESCFPRLPSGGCWPPDPGAGYQGCFPGHELRPVRQGRAPSNNGLLPARTASACVTAGAVATAQGSYVCVARASRPQVNRKPLRM